MSMRDDVVKRLQSGGRFEEGVNDEPEADIANLRVAVRELQTAVVYLAEELDRRDSHRSGLLRESGCQPVVVQLLAEPQRPANRLLMQAQG